MALDDGQGSAFGVIDRPQNGRRQSRFGRAVTSGGLVIEGRAETVAKRESAGTYRIGDRVFHQKFGYGQVLSVDGDRLHVAFDKAGTKKVIDSFVETV